MGEKLSEKILEDKKIKEVEIEVIKPNALTSERVSIIIKRGN